MASYETDLVDIADLDSSGGTAVEPASLWTAGRSPDEADTDFPIQGTLHASLTMNTTGKAGIFVPGNAFSFVTGNYIFGWIIWLAPGAIANYVAGGLAMLLGSSASVFNVYYVGGKDFGSYPYGGWQNFAVDPERTPDENAGSPSTYDYVGAGANVLSAVSKGNPLGFDVFRYGRGEARIYGTGATFALLAAANDAVIARWGLFQAIEGGYKWKGLMNIGYSAEAIFTDANVSIVVDNTELVNADFNRIEIRDIDTEIYWTNVGIVALGTVSKGELEMIDNAVVELTGCTFTDLSTFIFQSNAILIDTTFRRCGLVTQGGALITGCLFEESPASASVITAALDILTGNTFVSDGSNHAVELTSLGDGTLDWDNLLSGYVAGTTGSPVTPTSTGNEALYVNVGSGIVTISVADGATVPSIRSAGATVNVVAGQKTLEVTVLC